MNVVFLVAIWIYNWIRTLFALVEKIKASPELERKTSILFNDNIPLISLPHGKHDLNQEILTDWTDKFGGSVANCVISSDFHLFRVDGIEGGIPYKVGSKFKYRKKYGSL